MTFTNLTDAFKRALENDALYTTLIFIAGMLTGIVLQLIRALYEL